MSSDISIYKPNQIVVKSNRLIETGYKLGKREQYFILYLISRLDSISQKEIHQYELSFDDIKFILNYDGVKRVANRDAVFEIMSNLNRTPIYWEKADENGELEERGQMTWISSLKHNVKTDTFTFTFDPNLKPFLLQLEHYFTKYALHNVKNFTRSHSIRMYEILKVYEKRGWVEIDVERLKFYLGIGEKYEKFYELKRWVLEPTKLELKEFTDIHFEYKATRKERKTVTRLLFSIKPNNPPTNVLSPVETSENSSIEELYQLVEGWNISRTTLEKYVEQYSEEYIRERITYLQRLLKQKAKNKEERISNVGGYFHRLMEEENLTDYLKEKEAQIKDQQERQTQHQQLRQQTEEQLQELQSAWYQEELTLLREIMENEPTIKAQAIQYVKTYQIKYYDPQLSDEENYNNRLFQLAVHNHIKTLFSAQFATIESKYKDKVEQLKKLLKHIA